MDKVVITCAVCGAETTREHNPNLPLTPAELAQASYDAYKAGAAVIHLHVRDKDGNATQDIEIFKETIKLIKEKCDVVVEITTGGAAWMTAEERMQVIQLAPEMASLDCGSVNFGDEHIVNTLPDMRKFAIEMKKYGVRPTLECFDISHVDASHILIKEGLLEPPFHYGFVLNVPGGVRYDAQTLGWFVNRLPAGSFWTIMGVGRASLPAQFGAIVYGGFIRVGFEDNVYFSKGVLANSNAQLVERAARIVKEAGMKVATPADVREMLKLRAV